MNCTVPLAISRLFGALVLVAILSPLAAIADETALLTFPADFVLDALARHPGFAAARSDLEVARAEARSLSRPVYNPELSAGYEEAGEDTAEVGISQTFDWSGRRSARTALGEAGLAAAQSIFEIEQRELTAEIIVALVDYEASRHLRALAEERLNLSADFLAVAEQRQRIGDISPTSSLSAQLAHSQALAGLSLAEAKLSRTQETLSVLWGEARTNWPQLPREPGITAAFVQAPRFDSLPELQLARAQAEMSEAQVRIARTNQRPDPTVGVRGGTEGDASLVGVEVSIPLFIRNSFSADLDAALAGQNSADQRYSVALRRANARLSSTNGRYDAASRAWDAWNANGAASLEGQRNLLARLWAAREIGVVEYIVQLDQTYDAQEAGINLRAQVWLSWVEWLVASNQTNAWVESHQ